MALLADAMTQLPPPTTKKLGLVIDLDPQGNASTGLGINPRTLQSSMYDVLLHDVPMDDAIEAVAVRNLFLAPANLDLAGAEIELVPAFSREMRLKNAVNKIKDDYDIIFIDCPPSLSLLTLNGLCSANGVIVPMQCEYFALEGLTYLVNTIRQVHANLNPQLQIIGLLRVMFDNRMTLQQQVSEQLKSHFGDKVFDAVIPRNVRLAEAPSYGQAGVVFDPSSRGAQAYIAFANEMIARSQQLG